MIRLIGITLTFLLLATAPVSADREGIGVAKIVNGRVEVVRDGAVDRLVAGAHIYRDDVIRTSGMGSVGITFRDETMLSLGSGGEIVIDEFVYDPAAGELAFATRIAAGVMAYTTGGIGRMRPQAVKVSTPLATIGIRGTRFIVAVEGQ